MPASLKPAHLAYGKYIRLKTYLRTIYLNNKYIAPIDPYQLIEVSPSEITERMGSVSGPDSFWFLPYSDVKRGDWDITNTRAFGSGQWYQSYIEHFKHDVPWEDTEYYQNVISRAETDGHPYGETVDEAKSEFNKYDGLFESIKKDGYRTQRELIQNGDFPGSVHRPYLPPELFEVTINIGRDGTYIFEDGRHRLFFAKVLNLDSIPVRVMVRHEQWQKRRDMIASQENENVRTDTSHPDLSETILE